MNKDNRRMDELLKKLKMFHKLGKKVPGDRCVGGGGGVKEQREKEKKDCAN